MVSIHEVALANLPQLDPELQWVATEMAALHLRERKLLGPPATVRSTVYAFAPHVASLVAERMNVVGDAGRLTLAEAGKFGVDALVSLDPKQELDFSARVDLAARFVAAAAQVRAQSPLQPPAPEMAEYWPFGQEGGFCNPNKLHDQQ